jgi:hypothetical protein
VRGKSIRSIRVFLLELVIYTAMVIGYFYVVLYSLTEVLKDLYDHNRKLYAIVALAVMVCQGVFLETATAAILTFIKSRMNDGE